MIVAGFLAASGLFAQNMGPRKSDKPFLPMLGMDLTEKQMDQMQDLELKQEKELIKLQSQLPAIEADLKQMVIADKFNEAKVKELLAQKAKVLSEVELVQILHKREVRDLLTPEQKKEFDIRTLKQGMGPHRGGPQPFMPRHMDKKGPEGCKSCDKKQIRSFDSR